MSLVTQISSVVTAIGTQFKAVQAKIGDLTTLTTTQKGSAVGAINELDAAIASLASSGGASIDDSNTSNSTVWSSSKTNTAINAGDTATQAALVDGAPSTFDTLGKASTAVGDTTTDFVAVLNSALA